MLSNTSAAKKVHTLGDSTMAPYDESATVTRGWGMYFGQFLTNGWTSVNYAKGGRDSRGGYNELWQTAKKNVEAGDYVIITFGHNDEKNSGMDGYALKAYYERIGDATSAAAVDLRGTVPSTTYKEWLGKIVDEAKALGATPIICSPVCRSYFSGSKIRRNGRHDLGDNYKVLTENGPKDGTKLAADDHTMDYAYHSEQLAKEKGVTFIDLTTATATLYESYGDAKCHEYLFDGEGSTHFNTTGALLVARECARLMKAQGILADNITLPTDITITPATGNLGEAYKGQTLQKEFTLNGFGLSPEEGAVSITASEGIQLSTDKNNWKQSLTATYTASTLVQTFYAKVVLTEDGAFSGTITVAQGSKTIEVPVTATAITLGGGTEVKAYWRLESDNACTLTGPATVIEQTFSGMEVQRYSNPNANTVWPEWTGYDATRKTQRNVIIGETWPADEIDDNPDRYIQWGIKPAAGTELKIDAISLFACGCGGNGMCCHIYYSTDGFETRSTLFEMKKMPANNLQYIEAKPVISLKEGQELLIRVYPWYNGTATGKTICLSDLTIHGMAINNSDKTVNGQNAAVTFKFDNAQEGQTATYSEDTEGWFKTSYTTLGANLYYNGVSLNQSKINPTMSNEGSANDGNAINFYLIPKKGLTFMPTKVSFKTTRYGTNGGKTDVSWVNSDGTVVPIENGLVSARNNDITEFSHEVTGAKISDGLCGLRLNLYSLGDNKQVGYGDIVIEGIVNGTIEDVRQCRLNVSLSDDAAGKLTITPNADIFDEDDEVTVSVAENFGYHFSAWVDANGNEVSKENPYKFNITGDTALKAVFTKKPTYALNLVLSDGARDNLVQISPAGTMIDGKRMYEEGTDVKLTALNNKILTFTNWEDNTTMIERDVKMDGEKNLTANFSSVDYIVGWDLYQDAPKSDRSADYASDSENAGILSLRNAAGETTSWLANGVVAGKVQGRYGIRVWRPIADNWYFEVSFSSKGYQNLKLSAAVGDDYNAYSIIHAEYSTDGTNFTKFGTYELPNRGWTEGEFNLPAEANNQQRVYIRFMPDYTSPKVGVESNNDGTMLTDVFVLAEATGATDAVPTLVSSNPAKNATGVSASGSVILTFDNKVKAGTGFATLAGEQMAPVISGKTAVFKYSGLKYSTQYTFSLPEGVLTSRSGKPVAAMDITFTTMERTQPEARLYDAIVAQDGSGDYATLQAAIDAAPNQRAKPWLIFVKNGQYKEHIDIPATKPYLHIIGQDRDKAVILDNRLSGGDNAYSVDPGATVVVKGANTFFENITLENSYGHEKLAGPQALALNTQADRVALNNVALLSYQDTWITSSTSNNRHYIKNSLIEGAVDFIYNSGNVFLDGDTIEINRPSGGFIVAPSHDANVKWGYVFMNNIIRPRKGIEVTDVWLGRPWHNSPKTVFINTQTYVNIPAAGWFDHMGGLPSLWADYNTVDAKGNPVDLSQRRDTYWKEVNGEKVYGKAKNHLTAEEAAQYTIKNVMGGTDGWQPDLLCEACDAPVVKGEGSQLSWQPVPYAICYVVTKNGEVAGFTTETTFNGYTPADTWQVQAVNEYGGLSPKATANVSTHISQSSLLYPTSSFRHTSSSSIHSLSGQQIQHPQHGLNIIMLSDGTCRKYLKQ